MNDTPDDPRDPKLSRLYRKASQGEPPPALDAAILAAARTAAAPQRPPRPWWRRLQAPFALAASVVLAVILTVTMERNPPAEFDSPASAPGKERPAAEQKAPAGPDVGSSALPASPAAIAPERKDAPRRAEVKQEMPTDARKSLASPPSPAGSGAPESSRRQRTAGPGCRPCERELGRKRAPQVSRRTSRRPGAASKPRKRRASSAKTPRNLARGNPQPAPAGPLRRSRTQPARIPRRLSRLPLAGRFALSPRAARINILFALTDKVLGCTSAGCENYRNMLLSRYP